MAKSIMNQENFMDMLWGLIASDAGLRKRKSTRKKDSKSPIKPINATFQLTSKHKTWLEKISKELKKFGIDNRIRKHQTGQSMKAHEKKRARPYEAWRLETKTNKIFTKLHNKWYSETDGEFPNEKKILDLDFDKLSAIKLAYLIMGDGSNTKDHNSQKITISCESFTEDEQRLLIKKFKEIDIESRIESIRKRKRICISQSSSVNRIIEMIEPFVSSEFRYKLKKSQLIRPKFTRLKTEDIIEIGKRDPELAKKLVNDKKNKNRQNNYKSNEEYAQKQRDRSNKNYQNMTPEKKAKKAQRRRELDKLKKK